MRFRTHLVAASLAGAALYPRSPLRALLVALGGVALDVDHMLLYALRSGDWSPAGAMQYDRRRHTAVRAGDTRPRYGSLRSAGHRPELALPVAWLLALAFPALRPLAVGLTVHLALDVHLPHYDRRVRRRARGRCEDCGLAGVSLEVYYLTPPERGGDRWSAENRALLCGACVRERYARR